MGVVVLTEYSNVVSFFAYSERNMSSTKHFNSVKSTNNSSRTGRGRCHSDRSVTPASTSAAPLRSRGCRLPTNIPVTSADSDTTTGSGRELNTSRRRRSLDISKVRFCSHLCMYHVVIHNHHCCNKYHVLSI